MVFKPPALPVADPRCTQNWQKLKGQALGVPVGFIGSWWNTSAPDGWLLMDGSAISAVTDPVLVGIFGATLPDLSATLAPLHFIVKR